MKQGAALDTATIDAYTYIMRREKDLGRDGEEGRKFEFPCACANLRRATRAVTRLYDDELRGAGLTTTQFTLLQVLERAQGIRQGKLGALLSADSTTLTRTLAPLIRKGWIKSLEGEDRRERRMELTEAGRKKLERAWPNWEQAQKRLKAKLGDPGWEELQKLLGWAKAAAEAA